MSGPKENSSEEYRSPVCRLVVEVDIPRGRTAMPPTGYPKRRQSSAPLSTLARLLRSLLCRASGASDRGIGRRG
jgi:hypothetical protein